MFLTALLIATSLTVPAPAPADWSQPGFGPGDTYYNPAESTINATSIDAVRRRWSSPLLTADDWCTRATAPVAGGGRLFVPEETGIAAFQAGTGRLSWRFSYDDPEDESTPHLAVAGGLLLVGNLGCQSQSDPDGTVRALSATTGRVVWQEQLPFPVQSLVADRGIVVVSGRSESDEPTVVGLRLTDGAEQWQRAGYRSSGVSAAGRVLVSEVESDGTAALAVTTGRTVWTRAVAWEGESSTPDGGRFLVSDGSALVSVDAATGAVRWSAAGQASPRIATDGRRVYRSSEKRLDALDARTGRLQWSRSFPGYVGQPVRAGGLLYATVGGGAPPAVLTAADGDRASTGATFGPGIAGGVIVSGGRVFTVQGATVSGYGI